MRYISLVLLLSNSLFGQAMSDVPASSCIEREFGDIAYQSHQITPYGKLYTTHAHEVRPRNIQEIQRTIEIARKTGKKLSVIGAGMSQGQQAISTDDDNIVINTVYLNDISIDPATKIAKVGAGATWCELQNKANIHGLAVSVMQASNIFSIGGSLSVNCHGWDHKLGSVRNTLVSLTLVNCRGRLQRLTPKDELFDYVLGGYGLFGVLVEAEILLTENIELEESGIEITPKKYYSYFLDKVKGDDAITMHLYRLSLEPQKMFRTGVAVNWVKMNDKPLVATLVDEEEHGSRKDRITLNAVRCSKIARKAAWNLEKAHALGSRRASRNELMRPPIKFVLTDSEKQVEWLQEYFINGEQLTAFLDFLAKILNKNDVPVLNASVRFVKQDLKTKLSYAPANDRFAVVLFFNQHLTPAAIERTSLWVREVIDYIIVNDGSYYLPYQHFATLEQFQACYPKWELVLQKKQTDDPDTLFTNGLFTSYIANKLQTETKAPTYFCKVFDQKVGQRDGVKAFLDNIFMQLDKKKFFSLVDAILQNRKLNDDQVYEQLSIQIPKARRDKFLPFRSSLKALGALKQDLSNYVANLLSGKAAVTGYVEIGYNGRLVRSLKKHFSILKPIYVCNDKESFRDFFERGARPYDSFVPLNNYDPVQEDQIPSSSVDLVACYIGLHHIPPDKIDPFLDSIQRILRPGGSFVLMEHDASTKELQELVDVVHSIFNAATGVSPEDNKQEIRNFQSLDYWINRVELRGLKQNVEAGAYIRDGDSTLNTLVRFDKPMKQDFPNEAQLFSSPEYVRPLIQTYLTAPEWQNVRSAQEYARFVENKPFYRYPYFKDIRGFWKVFGNSFKAANAEDGFTGVAVSEYTLMNLFVGASMTLEYAVKGILSAPLAIVLPNKEQSVEVSGSEQERLRSLKAYGAFINHTPFYEYPYFRDIKGYWASYHGDISQRSKDRGVLGTVFSTDSVKDLFLGSGMTLEYLAKGIVSSPIRFFFTSPGNKEAETIHVLVEDVQSRVGSIDSRIKIIEAFPHNLQHIEVPRYVVFTEIMKKMALGAEEIKCINIAGQTKIQIDVKMASELELNASDFSGCKRLYVFPVPTDPAHKYVAYEIEVEKLQEAIRRFVSAGIEIIYIHDY